MRKNVTAVLLFALFGLTLVSCKPVQSPGNITTPAQKTLQSILDSLLSRSRAPEPEVFEAGARVRYCAEEFCLILEFLEDDLLHGEFAVEGSQHDLSQPISVSPMINKTDFTGPVNFSVLSNGSLVTDALRVSVDAELCFTVVDTQRKPKWQFTRICPKDMEGYRKHLSIESPDITDIYGLGEQFIEPGVTDGNWFGKVRFPGIDQGNAMVSFSGGMAGNAQFSIAYILGAEDLNYALFIDDPAAQTWNFNSTPWDINVAGNAVRFYVMSGSDLPHLRQDYMALTGTSPVPPKKMFGLWVSEYGYDNWEELEDKLTTLRANHFPVDGFVLDLLWFGGITSGSEDSDMGGLNWDTTNFPDPAGHIAQYAKEGIGIMTIEEPHISAGLPEYDDLAERGFLVEECKGCKPVYLESNPWWGIGGMVDYTDPEASTYWHDTKRQPLIDVGVIGHWTDLGEPEMFDPVSWYYGILDEYVEQHNQFDVHNLYNFYWSQSIYDGYIRNNVTQRPFILSRSGAPGIQRFGVSMWSGDVASNLDTLAAQIQVQGQMSLSGIDYFGSDIGGFYRSGLVGGIENVYSPWLAAGALLDVPFRTHTMNLCNCLETAPDRVGDVDSNLASVRLRYELSPYLYSLAHRASLYGEPVFPPLVYYFQQDEQVRELGGEKMIGSELLAAFSATLFQEYRDIYLPAGDWVDYYSNEWIHSGGEWIKSYPMLSESLFRLPLFLRAGAIVPLMYVDDQTMNISGLRMDGSVRDELILRVVASTEPSSFNLYEDDGVSTAYQNGAVRTTLISQQQDGKIVTVRVDAAQGTFEGANLQRNTVVELVVDDPGKPVTVTLNGTPLVESGTEAEWQAMDSGWYVAAPNLVLVKTGQTDVEIEKVIEIEF